MNKGQCVNSYIADGGISTSRQWTRLYPNFDSVRTIIGCNRPGSCIGVYMYAMVCLQATDLHAFSLSLRSVPSGVSPG